MRAGSRRKNISRGGGKDTVFRANMIYVSVNERDLSGTWRLQALQIKTAEDFKYLGSTVQSGGECRKELKSGLDRRSGEKCQVRCVTREC